MLKKLLLFLCLFFSCCPLFALYTGNPASPSLLQKGLFNAQSYFISVSTGYIYDNVWDKNIVPTETPDFVSLEKVGDFEVHSNFASFALVFLKRLEIYTYLGVSKENIDWKTKIPFSSTEINTKNHFSYSVGAKAIMLQFSSTVFSIDFQYFTLPKSNKMMQKIVNIYMPMELSKQYLNIKEWQLAFGIATRLGPLTPYVGGDYSHLRLQVKTENDFPTLDFKNKRSWGIFFGSSLNISSILFVTGEMRFFNEKAFSLSATTDF